MRPEIRDFITNTVMEWDADECLPWPFYTNADGYGRFRSGGAKHIASRFVCQMFWGAPPTPEHEAAHACGNGHLGCVNPWHLSWKTQDANQRDRATHGTSNAGSRNGRVVLTEADVSCIRAWRHTFLQKDLAVMFDVAPRTISAIMRNEIWKHVPDKTAAPLDGLSARQ